MKVLCIILSVFVVLLSARPCCTDDLCQTQSSAQKHIVAKSATPEKECQGCSPFFSCGTCAGFIVSKPVMHNLLFVTESIIEKYPAYQQPYAQEITLSIWQPPKIS